MINPVNQIIEFDGNDWRKFLENICLYDIFKEVIEEYGGDMAELRGIVRYIVWAYSVQSEKVLISMDWLKNKRKIFEAAELSDSLWLDVAELRDDTILNCIKRWIDFQDSEVYTELITLKELRQQMQAAAISDIKTASDEINYDQKQRCAQHQQTLSTMIRDVESNLLQNNIQLKDAIKEVKSVKVKNTMSVESFAK